MRLVIGGAYQGKLDYARTAYEIQEEEIYICTPDEEPDFTRRCLVHYEAYVLYCMRNRKAVQSYMREDAIVIAEDIFCGVVPVDEEVRAWREETGRVLTALAAQAESVTRIFCGLPLELK